MAVQLHTWEELGHCPAGSVSHGTCQPPAFHLLSRPALNDLSAQGGAWAGAPPIKEPCGTNSSLITQDDGSFCRSDLDNPGTASCLGYP